MKFPRNSAVVTAAMALALTGCATSTQDSSDEEGGSDGGPVTLRFQSLAFQDSTIAATEDIVKAWNDENPDIQVKYLQGSWDSVQDQLVTQFQGGTAPDVIQYESAAMTQFAQQGYLADLSDNLSDEVKDAVSDDIWKTVTVDDQIIAAPTLLQSYMVFANRGLLEDAGVEVPTGDTWSWDDFQAAAQATSDKGHQVGWGLDQPTATMLSLGLNFGGTYFEGSGEDAEVQVEDDELALPERIHEMTYEDESLDKVGLTQNGSDVMSGFLRGDYAMTVQGSYSAQTLAESAPKDLDWVVLPTLEGDTAEQAANPQTLSVSAQSPHVEEATEFINFYMEGQNLAAVAEGDWLIPASAEASEQVQESTGGENGWSTILSSGDYLTQAPFQGASNYPQWKDQIATPAYQKYLLDDISADELAQELTEGWDSVNN